MGGTGSAANPQFIGLPTTRTLLDNAVLVPLKPGPGNVPFLTYYGFDANLPASVNRVLSSPVTAADAPKVVQVNLSFMVRPTGAKAASNRDITFQQAVYFRHRRPDRPSEGTEMPVTRRLRGEGGFTLITVMGTMVIAALLTVAAFAAVNGDASESSKDVGRKQAWPQPSRGSTSTSSSSTATTTTGPMRAARIAVNDLWNGQGTDPRQWRNVTGSNAQYTIELIPANGFAKCTPGASVAQSMIDAGSRSLRVRVTGRAPSAKGWVNRSVIATLKRDGFLDFLYFTDYETRDPAWYSLESDGRPTGGSQGDLISWATTNCRKYWRNGRGNGTNQWSGKYTDAAGGNLGPIGCTQIQFAPGDVLAGPLHTNDDLYTCDKPTFGRNAQDRVESATATGPRAATSSRTSSAPSWRTRRPSACRRRTRPWPRSPRPRTPSAGRRRSSSEPRRAS